MNNRVPLMLVTLVVFLLLASVLWDYLLFEQRRTEGPILRQKGTEGPLVTNLLVKVRSESESMIHLTDFDLMVVPTLKNATNQALVSQDCPNIKNTSKDQIIIITNAVYIKHEKYGGTDHLTLELRWIEMMATLEANLNHPSVKKLVVFVEHKEAEELLLRYDFGNSNKLIIYNIGREVEFPHLFDYGTKCFMDEVIAVTNFDAKFASGWEKLNFQHLRSKKWMYAITRHASTSKCRTTIGHGVCDEGFEYLGSHDTYVFHVKEHLTYDHFPELQKKLFFSNGIENVIIWTFRETLGYAVTNPCKILYVHHEHCIKSIRNQKYERPRINGRHSGLAPFTWTLD